MFLGKPRTYLVAWGAAGVVALGGCSESGAPASGERVEFAGVFVRGSTRLVLRGKNGRYTGALLSRGRANPVRARAVSGKLLGTVRLGNKVGMFTATEAGGVLQLRVGKRVMSLRRAGGADGVRGRTMPPGRPPTGTPAPNRAGGPAPSRLSGVAAQLTRSRAWVAKHRTGGGMIMNVVRFLPGGQARKEIFMGTSTSHSTFLRGHGRSNKLSGSWQARGSSVVIRWTQNLSRRRPINVIERLALRGPRLLVQTGKSHPYKYQAQ